jgi:hypothetical protein
LHWERVTESFRTDDSLGSQLMFLSRPLPEKVALGRSVAVPATMLTVILDALVSGAHHEISLDSVNRIVSQQGSRISKFCDLPTGKQRRAEQPLYTEILATLY